MLLTADNYYTPAANYEYMSVSQYKNYVGTYGRRGCEAAALAMLKGEYEEPMTTAMLIGSYVDAWFEGSLDDFCMKHPELYRGDGELRSEYVKANYMIDRAARDPLFMQYMGGEPQVIMTGELFGTKWKIKMDSYHPGVAIVDLKCMQSLMKLKWVKDLGYIEFVRYWGYDIQGAIYREIVYQNTGKILPFYIAGISKEDEPDLRLIRVKDVYLKEALAMVERNMPRILRIRAGEEEPDRCELCPYCRRTRVLTAPVDLEDLVPDFM